MAVQARVYSSFMHDESQPSPTDESRPLAAVSDDDLLRRLGEILAQSRRVETELVAHIAEVDGRRLYAREAFPSMFAYCTGALHLSESEAYRRIAVARASREHPVLLAMLGDGRLHLSGIVQLAPCLTPENRDRLLRRATHRSKRQIEELVAELAPREDVPALMRRLPVRRAAPVAASAASVSTLPGMGRRVTPSLATAASTLPPAIVSSQPQPAIPSTPRPVVQPLAPGRYKVQFTASARLQEKLERLRALLRTQVPDGDLGAVIEVAVSEKLERLEARRFATTSRPRMGLSAANTSPASRHIPAAVRRAVRERDGNRCRYVDAAGRRCDERHRLEYHHLRPFGVGGDHRPENIHLVCRAHNGYLAEHDYGRTVMARFRREGKRASGPPPVASSGPPTVAASGPSP